MKSFKSHGPIADKLIRGIRKASRETIVKFEDWKYAKKYSNAKTHNLVPGLAELHPLYSIYTDVFIEVQNFIEYLVELPGIDKLHQSWNKAQDTYLPSYPPMSPITDSYFSTWSVFDMAVGVKRESYATLMIDCLKSFHGDPSFLTVLEAMQRSRMGLYFHEGFQGDFILLRELYTNQKIKADVPNEKHKGVKGEFWFVRLLPDFSGRLDYSLAFTTPYILVNTQAPRSHAPSSHEKMWLEFIERNLFKMKKKTTAEAYDAFMKFGLNQFYWLEYIFLAYVNFTADDVSLTGLPDRLETLPHANLTYT